MSDTKILATGPIDQIAIDILSSKGEVIIAPDGKPPSLLPLLDNVIGLVVRGDGLANAEVIDAAQELKVIGRCGVGYDQVDVAAATRRNIPLVYAPGAGARAVAEASVALVLALCKRLSYWDQQFKAGNWRSRYETKPGDLDGATLGIVGLGRIGQILAELIRPFNMTILSFDPYVTAEQARPLGVEMVDLDTLLASADFICLHAPSTPETRGLINRERLKSTKRGAYLINLARGGLIESFDVLLESLENGTLSGVALDVFEPEPPDSSHPLFRHPDCLTAPHALGMTPGAMGRIFKSMADDMVAVLEGRRPQFVVNPEVLE